MYSIPANTKHLYNFRTMLDQRRGRWAVVQMSCKIYRGIVLTVSSKLRIIYSPL